MDSSGPLAVPETCRVKDGGAADRVNRLENGDSLFSPHGGDRSASLLEFLVIVCVKSEIDNDCESNP